MIRVKDSAVVVAVATTIVVAVTTNIVGVTTNIVAVTTITTAVGVTAATSFINIIRNIIHRITQLFPINTIIMTITLVNAIHAMANTLHFRPGIASYRFISPSLSSLSSPYAHSTPPTPLKNLPRSRKEGGRGNDGTRSRRCRTTLSYGIVRRR